jgi:hypothetical protein
MRDRPDGARLLALVDELAGEVDPALRERARAIAARESAAGDAPLAACRRALAALYGAGDLPGLFARLAQDIRAGAFYAPGPAQAQVLALLWAVTRQKLRESNPDYLAACGADERAAV